MPEGTRGGRAAVPGDLRIPPTSNQAERDLRPSKTQQKISGRLRSETATRNRYAIRGNLNTARKHGADIMYAIRDALAGNPWMPPIPHERNNVFRQSRNAIGNNTAGVGWMLTR